MSDKEIKKFMRKSRVKAIMPTTPSYELHRRRDTEEVIEYLNKMKKKCM